MVVTIFIDNVIVTHDFIFCYQTIACNTYNFTVGSFLSFEAVGCNNQFNTVSQSLSSCSYWIQVKNFSCRHKCRFNPSSSIEVVYKSSCKICYVSIVTIFNSKCCYVCSRKNSTVSQTDGICITITICINSCCCIKSYGWCCHCCFKECSSIRCCHIRNFNSFVTIAQSQIRLIQLQEILCCIVAISKYYATFCYIERINTYKTSKFRIVMNTYNICSFVCNVVCCFNYYCASFVSCVFVLSTNYIINFLVVSVQRHPDNVTWFEINVFFIVDCGGCFFNDVAVFVCYKQFTIKFEVAWPISLVIRACAVLDSESVSAHAQYHSRSHSYGKYFFHSLSSS